ncbi:hypothetical protein [Aeromonas phage SW69-9]|nr:hypothetical protein [Aeromonas phage SW69-9]
MKHEKRCMIERIMKLNCEYVPRIQLDLSEYDLIKGWL